MNDMDQNQIHQTTFTVDPQHTEQFHGVEPFLIS